MAKKYNGTINFASALRPTGAQPLDDRMVVQSMTDLMSVDTFEANGASAAYNGMMVAVINEQKVFMLVDAANLTSENSWVVVGSGNITEDVTELQTKVTNLETAVGKDGDEPSGLYKTIADAISTAATDAQGKADAAQSAAEATAAAALDTYKGEMTTTLDGKANVGDSYLKSEADAKFVAQAEGERLMTDAEGTKLNGIAEGAQVNVIEKIIFNGTPATVDVQDKSVTLTTPVDYITGLGTDEKVLSVADGKLTSTLSLNYYTGENTDGETVYEIQLVGKDNTVVGRIDAKDFVKDGMLNNVELKKDPENKPAGTYLVFTWNNEAGTTDPMYVPVTDLIDVYEGGNGIALDGKKFSIELKAGEEFLEVTEDGLATKGIADAITTAKNAVVGDATTDTKDSLTLHGVKKYAADALDTYKGEMTTTLEGKVDTTTYNEKVQAIETTIGTKVDKAEGQRLMTDAEGTKLEGIAEGAQVNVIEAIKVNGVEATVAEGGKVAEVTVDGTKVLIGADIQGDVKNTETGEVSKETIYEANSTLANVLQGIQDSVSVAISGALTSVVAGNGIEVTEVVNNQQTVSIKVANTEGNLIVADENGIFAAMYYEGDDTEDED